MALRIAITGAAGHTGRALVRRLLEDDEVERIVALDRVARGGEADPRVVSVTGDVRDPGIAEHFRGCQTVAHLAFVVEQSPRDESLIDSVNTGGTKNVLQAAAKAGVEQILYTSSIASYGFHASNWERPLTEEDPLQGNPEFYYTRTKAEVERLIDGFEAEHPQLAIARLRPSAFLSIGSDRPFARALQGRVVTYVDPERVQLPIHMTEQDDVVEALMLALKQRARGAFNIATDEPLPINTWGQVIGKPAVRIPGVVRPLLAQTYRWKLTGIHPCWLRLAACHPILVSNAKAKRELGWAPRYPTTASALRAITQRPTARASRPTKLVLGAAALATRLKGEIGSTPQQRYESRAITGAMNLLFTGERGSEWHATFDGGRTGVQRGLHRAPRATLTMSDETFHDLLAGRLSYSVAQMTGKIRFRGSGDYQFFMGAFVQRFKDLHLERGAEGLVGRLVQRAVG